MWLLLAVVFIFCFWLPEFFPVALLFQFMVCNAIFISIETELGRFEKNGMEWNEKYEEHDFFRYSMTNFVNRDLNRC